MLSFSLTVEEESTLRDTMLDVSFILEAMDRSNAVLVFEYATSTKLDC